MYIRNVVQKAIKICDFSTFHLSFIFFLLCKRSNKNTSGISLLRGWVPRLELLLIFLDLRRWRGCIRFGNLFLLSSVNILNLQNLYIKVWCKFVAWLLFVYLSHRRNDSIKTTGGVQWWRNVEKRKAVFAKLVNTRSQKSLNTEVCEGPDNWNQVYILCRENFLWHDAIKFRCNTKLGRMFCKTV